MDSDAPVRLPMEISGFIKRAVAGYCWVNPKTQVLHRLDGPAIEYADGTKMWYINGRYYCTEDEYIKERDRCIALKQGSLESGLDLTF